MSDLFALIKLHKYELDEKRLILAKFYEVQDQIEANRLKIEQDFEKEKKAVEEIGDIHFTFAGYRKNVKAKLEQLEARSKLIEEKILESKDDMMDSFAELKKYEITQEEREKLERAEQALKDGKELDEIGLESFRRQHKE